MTMNDLRNIWPEWEVEKELGTGSFGTVYKVVRRDYELESYAAIKVITIPSNESEVESLRSDGYDMKATKTYFQEIVNDFVNEIRLMESLKGMQNIVSVEDYKVVENSDKFGWTIYIRMELLTPFNTYTCDKKLTEAEVIKLGCDICSALEICSKRNIIHRDIKPENIFINDFGYFKLGDFGIARKMENMTSGLSRKGTPNYMAPEVANSSDYDSSVDIYSLGLVLYKLLNGNRLPFLDKKQIFSHGDKMNALNRRLGGEALPVPCDASPAMAKLILRACAYDPSKRFSSATEMKEALMHVSNNYQEEISKDEMEKNELSKIWPEWEIEKELGRGYLGIVYKAVSRKQLVKYAAIKVISIPANVSEVDSLYSEGMDNETVRTCLKEMVNDIVSELKLMESINDTQNLVRIEDYKIIEKSNGLGWSIYIRMELLTPFNVYTSETKLTETEVIKLGSDICTALEVYSKHNIVYGDVKPDNIFIDDLGSYKLDMYRGEHGYVLRGASYYTAPEVVKGTSYDPSADTYSLGLVLYRLLNGNRLPFLDKKQIFSHGDKMNALNRRLGGEALPVPCDASPAMAKLILRACAYDPSKRFSSATEMKEALMSIGTYQESPKCLDKTHHVRRPFNTDDMAVVVRKDCKINAEDNPDISKKELTDPIKTGSEKVFQEYYIAAQNGDPEAQFNLAECFAKGTGTAQNIDEAIKWYSSAANQGVALAPVKLYFMYLRKKEEDKAVSILEAAAEKNNWLAMNTLAMAYKDGLGVEKNRAKYKYWQKKYKKVNKEELQAKKQEVLEQQHARTMTELEKYRRR